MSKRNFVNCPGCGSEFTKWYGEELSCGTCNSRWAKVPSRPADDSARAAKPAVGKPCKESSLVAWGEHLLSKHAGKPAAK